MVETISAIVASSSEPTVCIHISQSIAQTFVIIIIEVLMFTIMQLQVLHHSQQDQPLPVAMVSTKELVDQVATHYIHSLQSQTLACNYIHTRWCVFGG